MKRLLAFPILILFATLAAAQLAPGWYFNQMLYFWFIGNPGAYASAVASGSPCYAWIGGGAPNTTQPACYYDPSNTNPGYIPNAGEPVRAPRRPLVK